MFCFSTIGLVVLSYIVSNVTQLFRSGDKKNQNKNQLESMCDITRQEKREKDEAFESES